MSCIITTFSLLSQFNCFYPFRYRLLFSPYKYFKNTAKVIHLKEHSILVIVLKDWHPKIGLKGRSYKYHKDYRTRCSRTEN